jgi:large repetitive protein
MQIMNRWGVLVYETDGYGGENVFRGISEGRAIINANKELPTGTYYYILNFVNENPGKTSYAGYLYINK